MRNFCLAIFILFSFCLNAQIQLTKPDFEAVKQAYPNQEIAAVLIDSVFDFFDFAQQDAVIDDFFELKIKVEEASQLNLYFKESVIPTGSFLIIKTKGRVNSLKINASNLHQQLATPGLNGDQIIIQYHGPKEGASLVINQVGCFLRSTEEIETSAFCEVDVNCTEGTHWQDQKKGVVRLLLKSSSASIYCTGSLINNSARNCKPYLLSSQHCLDDIIEEDLAQTLIYFNYELSSCDAGDANTSQNMQGMQLKASTTAESGSDFALFELDVPIPLEFSPYFNGWYNQDIPSVSGASIHHPSGDVKKISTYSTPLSTVDVPLLQADSYWEVIWTETVSGHGVTESGSSGSPIFNNEKLIIGNLTGGTSYCSSPEDPDYYGKFSVGWNAAVDSTKRLDVWLDPLNLGEEKIPGSYYPCSDSAFQYLPIDSVAVLGNPASNFIRLYIEQQINSTIIIDAFSAGGQIVFSQNYPASNITTIEIPTFSFRDGVYFVRIQTGFDELIEKIVVIH